MITDLVIAVLGAYLLGRKLEPKSSPCGSSSFSDGADGVRSTIGYANQVVSILHIWRGAGLTWAPPSRGGAMANASSSTSCEKISV